MKHPTAQDAQAAHRAVKRAFEQGLLRRLPCEECGASNAQAHHDDYSKPLEVRWLCKSHHRLWHLAHPTGIDWPQIENDHGLVTIKTSITESERERLFALADAEMRSVSQVLRLAVRDYLKARAA